MTQLSETKPDIKNNFFVKLWSVFQQRCWPIKSTDGKATKPTFGNFFFIFVIILSFFPVCFVSVVSIFSLIKNFGLLVFFVVAVFSTLKHVVPLVFYANKYRSPHYLTLLEEFLRNTDLIIKYISLPMNSGSHRNGKETVRNPAK